MNKLIMLSVMALSGLAVTATEVNDNGESVTNKTVEVAAPMKHDTDGINKTVEAAAPACNMEIKKLLDEASLKYRICDDGDFKMTFEASEGRYQNVFISTEIDESDGYRTFEVYSVCYEGPLTKAMAMDLLKTRYRSGGSWLVEYKNETGRYSIIYLETLPLYIKPSHLFARCSAVAHIADKKEADWTDGDNL